MTFYDLMFFVSDELFQMHAHFTSAQIAKDGTTKNFRILISDLLVNTFNNVASENIILGLKQIPMQFSGKLFSKKIAFKEMRDVHKLGKFCW